MGAVDWPTAFMWVGIAASAAYAMAVLFKNL